MRPGRAAIFWTALPVGLLAAVLLYGIFFPPGWVLEAVAHRALGSTVAWRTHSRSGGSHILEDVLVSAEVGALHASRVRLVHSFAEGLFFGAWSFELRDIRIDPHAPSWPSAAFESGRLRWTSGVPRKLELGEWVSEAAQIDAVVEWSPPAPDGREDVRAVRVIGRARSLDLGQILKIWKPLANPPNPSDKRWRNFEIDYRKGALEIEVDSRPFFRASWQ